MKIYFSPVMRAFLNDLEEEALQKNMKVDYETLKLVPLDGGYNKEWPMGDNAPQDPEQAGWDDIDK
jgi:hypothetical protein